MRLTSSSSSDWKRHPSGLGEISKRLKNSKTEEQYDVTKVLVKAQRTLTGSGTCTLFLKLEPR